MNNKIKLALSVLLLGCVAPLQAQEVGDCDYYSNWMGVEPSWYASTCGVTGKSLPVVGAPKAPTSPATALNIGGFGPPSQIISHPLNDFANNSNLGTNAQTLFAMESDVSGAVIYAIDNTAMMLGTLDPATGVFSAIGPATAQAAHTWTGLAMSNTGSYALSTDGATATLYTIDLGTGTVTPVGSDTGGPLMIDMAMTCDGTIYGHDIGTDQIFTIDAGTGGHTAIGPTGLAANFAQGMTLDRETGTVYVYGYTGGGTNTYGDVNLATGAVNPISVDNPIGEWVGATSTSCFVAPPAIVPTMSSAGLVVLFLALAGIAVFTLGRRRAQ